MQVYTMTDDKTSFGIADFGCYSVNFFNYQKLYCAVAVFAFFVLIFASVYRSMCCGCLPLTPSRNQLSSTCTMHIYKKPAIHTKIEEKMVDEN